jgi:peptidoglycan/LPS O-acetylase OafA/YrhL
VLLLEGATLGPRIFTSLFLVQAWVPSEAVFYATNSVTWSLSCEAAFYAVFPVLLPAMGHVPSVSRKRWIALLLLANVGIALFGQLALEGETQLWFVYIFPLARAIEFAIGMLVALEVKEGGLRTVSLFPAAVVALGAYAVAVALPQPFGWTAVMTLPFALLIAAAAYNDLDGSPSPLRGKWIVHLGAWSYAFFLLHLLVIRSAFVLGDFSSASQGALLVWIPVLFLISIGASILLFRFVEHPLEARLRHSPGSAVGAQGSQG